jgi:hypothetical protein
MSVRRQDTSLSILPPRIAYLFAPIDKRALGVAVGTVAGFGIAFVTAVHLIVQPAPEFDLALLRQYFPGYTVSWFGAWVGFVWAFTVGFFAGWLVAFTRNFVIASWLFLTRSRAELTAARDFLDHL